MFQLFTTFLHLPDEITDEIALNKLLLELVSVSFTGDIAMPDNGNVRFAFKRKSMPWTTTWTDYFLLDVRN